MIRPKLEILNIICVKIAILVGYLEKIMSGFLLGIVFRFFLSLLLEEGNALGLDEFVTPFRLHKNYIN
jgi:hypothetical protein